MTLTFGSLFAGIGGFDLGFERAGMKCLWQVEIDDYANRVLEKHWPNVKRWRDVRTFPQPGFERVDVICGGFPCQDISYAGKGAGLAGERSGLFYEVIRIVREMEPRFVCLENVAALLTRGMGDVLGSLASIGFDAEWHCIPAASVGAPHIRDRVFILAYANSVRPFMEQNRSKLGKSRSREKEARNQSSICTKARSDASDANSEGLQKRQRQDTSGAWQDSRAKPSRSEWWAVEPDVGRVANGVPKRVDRIKGLGNAVVPQVAQWIGERIMEAVT